MRHFLTSAQSICIIYHPQHFVSAILSMWLCFIQVVYCPGGLFINKNKMYKMMKICFNFYFRNQCLHEKYYKVQGMSKAKLLAFVYIFMKESITRNLSSGKIFHFSIVCSPLFAQMVWAMKCNQCSGKSEGNIVVGWRQDLQYRFLTESKPSFLFFFSLLIHWEEKTNSFCKHFLKFIE